MHKIGAQRAKDFFWAGIVRRGPPPQHFRDVAPPANILANIMLPPPKPIPTSNAVVGIFRILQKARNSSEFLRILYNLQILLNSSGIVNLSEFGQNLVKY